MKLKLGVEVEVGVRLLVWLGGWSDKMKVIRFPTLVLFEVTTCPDGWVGGGLNDNNAILNSVDVVVEVGVELGNNYVSFPSLFL